MPSSAQLSHPPSTLPYDRSRAPTYDAEWAARVREVREGRFNDSEGEGEGVETEPQDSQANTTPYGPAPAQRRMSAGQSEPTSAPHHRSAPLAEANSTPHHAGASPREVARQPAAAAQPDKAAPSSQKKRGRPKKTDTATTTGGKERQSAATKSQDFDMGSDGEPQPKRGRKGGCESGALNYTKHEIFHLLRLIEAIGPHGEQKWSKVGRAYARWARRNGRPARNPAALRGKFQALVRMGKPTGRGKCPRHIEKAIEINEALEGEIAMGEVDDSSPIPQEWERDVQDAIRAGDEYIDDDRNDDGTVSDTGSDLYITNDEGSDGNEDVEPLKTQSKKSDMKASTTQGRTSATVQRNGNRARELLLNLEGQLDPAKQDARCAEREESRHRRQQEFIQAIQSRDDRLEILELRRQNTELMQQLMTAQLQLQELRQELRFMHLSMGMGFGAHAATDMGLGAHAAFDYMDGSAFGNLNNGDVYPPYM